MQATGQWEGEACGVPCGQSDAAGSAAAMAWSARCLLALHGKELHGAGLLALHVNSPRHRLLKLFLLGYPQRFSLNFSLYITFCVTSSTFHLLFFYLPQRFPLNTLPIPHYNYKISFSISTINFYLLTITRGPTAQCRKG
jgi:hypothetical protein